MLCEASSVESIHGDPSKWIECCVKAADGTPFSSGGFGEVFRIPQFEGIVFKKIRFNGGSYTAWVNEVTEEVSVHAVLCTVEGFKAPNLECAFILEEDCAFIVMEEIKNGDLFEAVNDVIAYKKEHTSLCNKTLLRKLLENLAALHAAGFAHRDIKPENILLDHNGDPVYIDYGFFTEKGEKESTKRCGTPEYVAPEVMSMAFYHGPTADIFSLGCVFYMLARLNYPNRPKRFGPIATHSTWWTTPLGELVKAMTDPNPTTRVDAAGALELLDNIDGL